jgi:membrane protease YdiL (CAAX protease family)
MFLRAHGEDPRDVFFGTAPIGPEIRRGIGLIFVALILAAVVMLTVQLLAPRLHNVTHNPLQDLIRTPLQAALFGIVVVVAGGVREELQRAFVLRRFERHLGGAAVGVVVWSIAFGAFHKLQGLDAAIATGILGAFWAVVYLWRRSVVAPMVSHAGFNLLEVLLFVTTWR